MKEVIGITGNSGSGKTRASKIISELKNALIIDADQVVKKLSKPHEEYFDAIKDTFGEKYFLEDGNLNRKLLAKEIYENKESLEKLNSLTFKYVVEEIKREIDEANYDVIIVDAPLLFESGLDKCCTKIIVLVAPLEIKVRRIMERDNLTEETALSRIKIQTKEDEYKKNADVVIENIVDEELENKIKDALNKLKI